MPSEKQKRKKNRDTTTVSMGLPFCITFCHHLIRASRAHSFHCFYYDPTVHTQCVRLLNDMRLSLSEKIPRCRRRFFQPPDETYAI